MEKGVLKVNYTRKSWSLSIYFSNRGSNLLKILQAEISLGALGWGLSNSELEIFTGNEMERNAKPFTKNGAQLETK